MPDREEGDHLNIVTHLPGFITRAVTEENRNRTKGIQTEPNRTKQNQTEPKRTATEPKGSKQNQTEPNRTKQNQTEPKRTEAEPKGSKQIQTAKQNQTKNHAETNVEHTAEPNGKHRTNKTQPNAAHTTHTHTHTDIDPSFCSFYSSRVGWIEMGLNQGWVV
jgi:hypothetical protein